MIQLLNAYSKLSKGDVEARKIATWNSKQPVLYGCFNWMIPNLYMGNGCLTTKHPLKTGCLEFQVSLKNYSRRVLEFDLMVLFEKAR